MTPIVLVESVATLLWAYALVLAVSWFRAVARDDRKAHVGHFVSLMGAMVPFSASVIALVFIGGTLGLPSVVVFLAVLLPAGLVTALQLEVSRMTGPRLDWEARRVAFGLCLGVALIVWRVA